MINQLQKHPPKFGKPVPSFASDLRKEIQEYFQKTGLSKYGGRSLIIKAVVLMVLFSLNYYLLIFVNLHWGIKIFLSISLGFLTAFIGFNIMHDGAHQSFSKNKKINQIASYTLNLLGANVFFWKTKHNIVHHTFTNIPHVDDDIDAGIFLYLNPESTKLKIHKYQHIYFPLVYSFLYIYWVFYADYVKYFKGKVGIMEIQNFNRKEKLIFWLTKISHLVLFIVIPIVKLGFWHWMLYFSIYVLSAGFILSIVFQLAHVVEETEFLAPDDENLMEDEWMKHQLRTTANFSMDNKILTWFLGGLNFQIEHHLFPTISHIHYPALSKIVRKVCEKYNVPYISHPNLMSAIRSHYMKMKNLASNSQKTNN